MTTAIERLWAVAALAPGDTHDAIVAAQKEVDALRADRGRLAARVAELEAAALVAESAQREEDLASIGDDADPCPVDAETLERWGRGQYLECEYESTPTAPETARMVEQVAWLTRRVQGRGR